MNNSLFTKSAFKPITSLPESVRVHFASASRLHTLVDTRVNAGDLVVLESLADEEVLLRELGRRGKASDVHSFVLAASAGQSVDMPVQMTPQSTLALDIVRKGFGERLDTIVASDLAYEVGRVAAGTPLANRMAVMKRRIQGRAGLLIQ